MNGGGTLLDLAIIGGGINGAGIARDAAGRGLKVALFEQHDLAEHTSSKSTKLIHGGLRYLEYYEFRLVREALQERSVLLGIAPHIIHPLRFVLPHAPQLRPVWMIRAGLFLYDWIGGHTGLPGSHGLRLTGTVQGAPLKPAYKRGFVYSDAWVDDARLVALNAMDAAERGAAVHTRTRVLQMKREGGLWRIEIERQGGPAETVWARALVNAAGPWVEGVRNLAHGQVETPHVRLVKGSHIVTRKLFEGDHAYILQNPDKRIVFAIPYQGEFTLIGTTDEPFEGDPSAVGISAEETSYLCDSVNAYFTRRIAPEDVVWSFAGVRPLYDDAAANASAVTRDYVLDLDAGQGGEAPLLSIYGGKITTYRRLAEHALEKLGGWFPAAGKPWTGKAALPGGDKPLAALARDISDRHPYLGGALTMRLAKAYGSRALDWLGEAGSLADLGEHFGAGLTEAEASYLILREWAASAEDVLWRRTKLGLRLSQAEQTRFGQWFGQRRKSAAA